MSAESLFSVMEPFILLLLLHKAEKVYIKRQPSYTFSTPSSYKHKFFRQGFFFIFKRNIFFYFYVSGVSGLCISIISLLRTEALFPDEKFLVRQ
jgi:hypothetical protein